MDIELPISRATAESSEKKKKKEDAHRGWRVAKADSVECKRSSKQG